jgi:hypothetical protein
MAATYTLGSSGIQLGDPCQIVRTADGFTSCDEIRSN